MKRSQGEAERIEAAAAMGAEHGTAAGSWVVDGNTSADTLRSILRMLDEGDPAFEIPAPLSGEWAGDPTTDTVADALGVGEEYRAGYTDLSDAFEAYENAYFEAYAAEAERSARAMLPDETEGAQA